MVAGDIVPFDTVIVEVVEDRQAGFIITLSSFSVVGLGLAETAGGTPVPGISLCGRSDFNSGAGPEPSVDVWWLKISTFASGEVTFTTGCPDVLDTTSSYPLLDKFVFLGRLEGNGVHAVPAADVSCVKPVNFKATRRPVFPAEEVRMCYTSGIPVRRVSYT